MHKYVLKNSVYYSCCAYQCLWMYVNNTSIYGVCFGRDVYTEEKDKDNKNRHYLFRIECFSRFHWI